MTAETVAAFFLPLILGAAGILALLPGRGYFDAFLRGARRGLETAGGLIPPLSALLVGLRMLDASGAVDALSSLLSRPLSALGIPDGLLPLLLTRPFSGSGATATYSELLAKSGADSFPALCASVIMGSSDTFVYILGVYFSSIRTSTSRYAYPVAVAASLFGVFFSCLVSRWFIS